MNPLWNIPQFLMTAWIGALTQKQWKAYQAAVEQQIAEGRTGLEARSRAAMRMISENPDSAQARAILDDARSRVPARAYEEVDDASRRMEERRQGFLSDYDRRTGDYLANEELATAHLLGDLRSAQGTARQGYEQREKDVMALLEDYGTQALRDTEREFSDATDAELMSLASRGLAGSGVGSSIRGGLTTRKTDQMARQREAAAALKAQTLAGLRGEALGFGERAANLGAGFYESGIARRMEGRAGVEAGRAAYDAAMSGDTQSARERALDRAMGYDVNLNRGYADYLSGERDTSLGTYLQTTGDYWDFLNNINNVPPDRSAFNMAAANTGRGLGG